MIKDEASLIGPFLMYHSHLFGIGNIYIVDNGSTSPEVLSVLEDFEKNGGHVDRSHQEHSAYLRKGEIIGDLVKALEKSESYDFFVLLDCDEFVILKNRDLNNYTCDKSAIDAYFDKIIEERRVLVVDENLMNILGSPDYYIPAKYAKTIYPRDVFVSTDHGHHVVRAKNDLGSVVCDIVYVHMHFRPYDEIVRFARQKLAVFMPQSTLDDPEQLAKFRGPGFHMVGYLTRGEDAYNRSFLQPSKSCHFPDLGLKLNELGCELPFGRVVQKP